MTAPTLTDHPRSAVDGFHAVCDKFIDLSRTDQGEAVPVWGGTWRLLRYLLRHPIKGYVRVLQQGFRSQTKMGTLAPFFPLEAMAAFLSQFSEPELKAMKAVSEVHLRRVKSMITESPIFKLGAPIGAAYALLEVSNKLVTVRGSSLDLVRDIISSPTAQVWMGYLLAGFIFALSALAFQYIFTIGPTIARAQLLDDILVVALEEKRFAVKDCSTIRNAST